MADHTDWMDRILINNNGRLESAAEATVSAMDHGFLYGDSVYETLRTYHGKPFMFLEHMDRLERSVGRIGLGLPCSRSQLENEILRSTDAYADRHGASLDVSGLAVRVVVSRGVGPIGLDVSKCVEPRYLIYVFAVPALPEFYYSEGISVVVSKVRRNHPQALDPGIKSGNFLNNILAFNDAREVNAQEAILLNSEGYVAEGTTSNVFMVKDGEMQTPVTEGILSGITRAVVLEEARSASLPARECRFTPEELIGADEAFITSSIRGVVPVTQINGLPLGDGKPGPKTRAVMELYDARVRAVSG